MKTNRSLPLLCLVLVALALLSACREEKKEVKEEKPKIERRMARYVGLQLKMQNINETLNTMEQDLEVQNHRIQTVRAELAMVQEDLDELNRTLIGPNETSATIIARAQQMRSDRITRETSVKEKQEDSGNGVLSTLLILLAAILAVIYFAKVYRDRTTEEDVGESTVWQANAPPVYRPPSPEEEKRDDNSPAES